MSGYGAVHASLSNYILLFLKNIYSHPPLLLVIIVSFKKLCYTLIFMSLMEDKGAKLEIVKIF